MATPECRFCHDVRTVPVGKIKVECPHCGGTSRKAAGGVYHSRHGDPFADLDRQGCSALLGLLLALCLAAGIVYLWWTM